MTSVYQHPTPFVLENGRHLERLELAYTVAGSLHPNARVVWVFHAMSGTSNPQQWWGGLLGEGQLLNPTDYTIVCVNIPGSCYGSSGPLSPGPDGIPYYHQFPVFSVKDVVRAYGLVRAHLGIQRIYLGIGASMGGQHLLQWAVDEPELFEHIIPIACNARQSAWALAIDAAQRMAIEADATWPQADAQAGRNGMKAARALALVHYRSYQSFADKNHNAAAAQDAETYLRYQALRLAERFNAFSYYNLSLQRRTYDLSAGYDSAEAALQRITARCLVLGIANDGLFPLAEQAFLAAHIPGARLEVIESIYGHDAFLVEYEQLTRHISAFLTAPALPVAPPAVP